MNGILPLWKPKGMTSHDCVVRIRKLFKMKKVGHTGTLDPEVEGVLPLCLGEATKIVPYLTATHKTYVAEVKLGSATETEDAEGTIIEERVVETPPTKTDILSVLNYFTGTMTQIPPMYSAVKVNGKKLYEYARNNQTVERPERQITIHNIQLLEMNKQDPTIFKFNVQCSKGTYIRTLCVDIGKALGYPAHMYSLVRNQTGTFTKQDTFTFDTIEEYIRTDQQEDLLSPISQGIQHLEKWVVDEETKQRVLYGQKLPKPNLLEVEEPFAVMHKDQLLAIYEVSFKDEQIIKPKRVFNS